jgi:hypothetical protein
VKKPRKPRDLDWELQQLQDRQEEQAQELEDRLEEMEFRQRVLEFEEFERKRREDDAELQRAFPR